MQQKNYEQWKEAFIRKLSEYIQSVPELENRGVVEVQTTRDINGEKKEGLAMPGLNPSGVSPVVRLSSLYKGYLDGVQEDELITSVAEVFAEHRDMSFNTKEFLDYEKMKRHLRIRVSGVENNEEWIKEKICEVEGDFVHSCYLDFPRGEEGHRTINVIKQYAELWNVSEAQVMEDARRGSMQFEVEMTAMQDILNGFLSDEESAILFGILEGRPFEPMYVLCEKDSPFGASVIARQDILEAVGDVLQDDYYVLPSSIHEVIILPAQAGNRIGDLDTLVREVNENEVSSQEKLSDHVQFYDWSMNRLMNADEYRRKMERESEPEESNQAAEEMGQGLSF